MRFPYYGTEDSCFGGYGFNLNPKPETAQPKLLNLKRTFIVRFGCFPGVSGQLLAYIVIGASGGYGFWALWVSSITLNPKLYTRKATP